MKKFLVLHYGFVKPTPEEMQEWNQWFELIEDRQVERGHFPAGREISGEGVKELSFARDSITGYTILNAENLNEAESIVRQCPFVDSTRVYEIGN